MRGVARWLRPVAAVSIVGVVIVLAGCGSTALPPSPPPSVATAAAAVTPAQAASPTAGATAAATAAPGNTAQLAAGKAAFTASCGTCHMLTAAGTSGTLGPSLNGIGSLRTAVWIVEQIQNPCAAGHADAAGPKYTCSIMPAGLVSGAQAQAIAAYLASQK